MGGRASIQKGKRAEREVVNILQPIVERVCQREGVECLKLQRNLKQTQEGGCDLDGLDWIAIEIKHHKTPSLGSWWSQCLRQATKGRAAVLIWKPHGGKWRVRMTGQLPLADGTAIKTVVDIDHLDPFLVWFEMRLAQEIRKASLRDGEIGIEVVETCTLLDSQAPKVEEAPVLMDFNPGSVPAVEARFGGVVARPWERP